ncbi:ergothioneine biosynthesis glutamate--cysteine ligase EgtA [Candidatus Protofrankia californiensis]|uniref:ergothioneine biosynthesis glutamate--cysteine ligase EgtA n=1 Tax=Candidatus Protofrankia californiensis TaxID=1839754 RepID=UPI001F4967D7|nr:ergothioneine biosynthesis glutamate--cysteine ligase EgtA [Candidatus Protofrankia californiensis]
MPASDHCCTDDEIRADGEIRADDEIRSPDDVHRYAHLTCLTDQPAGDVGIETEWFVVDVACPSRPVPPSRTMAVLVGNPPQQAPRDASPDTSPGPVEELVLPGGTRITFEPGGQLELSAPPLPLPDALARTATDLAAVRSVLTGAGLALVGMGTDPLRPPRRQLHAPRYAAMEQYFRTNGGRAGEAMMCSTASVQVNLDAGTPAQWTRRFDLAHALGPVLVAMFAASPVLDGTATGWCSTRQALWADIDPTRTRPVATPHQPDPATAWADYLLAARVMLVRVPGGDFRLAGGGSTFADWVAGDGPVARPPTVADLRYHSTTVFPPVRPRGWLELRYLDAAPAGNWPVVVAVTTALLDDPQAADTAADACAPVAGRWVTAAALGLRDSALRQAARRCADAARDALGRLGAGSGLLAAVNAYIETYVEPGRCPADDLADRLPAGGPQGLLHAEINAEINVEASAGTNTEINARADAGTNAGREYPTTWPWVTAR